MEDDADDADDDLDLVHFDLARPKIGCKVIKHCTVDYLETTGKMKKKKMKTSTTTTSTARTTGAEGPRTQLHTHSHTNYVLVCTRRLNGHNRNGTELCTDNGFNY